MNKGKNKGKIQKSRQNAEGREAGSFLGKAFDSYHKFLSNKVINFVINMILAIGTVLPFMMKMCNKVAFTYEVNDDAAIVQILDGSYTGTPDGHAIFIKYPLSWIIAKLYELNPKLPFTVPADNGTNWYVTAIVLLEVFALAAVLFRILNYFRCNRILICFFYTLAFVYVWMPCFFHLTFSTVAAFLGCMSLLFTGFSKKEELWRPWNLLCLGILGISAYCMRKQCFYMVIPFLLLEIWYKYRMDFFRSVKPWFVLGACGVLGASILFLNTQMYGSMGWKNYFIYNHARAYMQDYAGMPDYEENEDFYQSIGVSENAQKVFKSYSYCLYDDFSTETIEKIYNYQKTQEPQLSLEQKAENAKEKAKQILKESMQGAMKLSVPLEVEFDENKMVTYTFKEAEELELAYAITIHKSQGSEYPAVIMPLVTGYQQLMTRNLLYTGITRAKSCVCIVGREDTFQGMIKNEDQHKRYSGLQWQLQTFETEEEPVENDK